MPGVPLPEMGPWKPRSLTIPPNSARAWVRLAMWQMWVGTIVCLVVGLGVLLMATSPGRIVTVADLSNCYGPAPIVLPCERIVYRGGALEAAFTALCSLMLIGVAVWFVWELWSAAEPKPITDDFLVLLNNSFGRDWRNPLKWPWARLLWAYGFAGIGAVATAGVVAAIWMLVATNDLSKPPTARIETVQSFRLGQ